MTLIGKPSLPANNYAELTKRIEANKGKINRPTPAWARRRTCAGCSSASAIQVDMQTVPYKGMGRR